LDISGGSPPYYAEWNKAFTGKEATGLGAGTYNLLLTDQNGCEINERITIIEPERLRFTSETSPSVNSLPNGRATVNVTGGTTPYIYEWNNDPTLNEASLSNLTPGTYRLAVEDANGCSLSVRIIVQSVLGIREELPGFNAWPNPLAEGDHLYLEGLPSDIQGWQLINLQGQMIEEGIMSGSPTAQIKFNTILAGTYVLRLVTPDKAYNLRLLLEGKKHLPELHSGRWGYSSDRKHGFRTIPVR